MKKQKESDQEQKSVSQKVWQQISENEVEPLPKWRWQLKELLNWGMFFLSVLLGSISVSIILLELFSADWQFYTNVTNSFFTYLFSVLPYFWIILLIVMVIIAYYRFFQTKKGYRFTGLRVLVFSLLLSFAIGLFLYFANVSFWLYDVTNPYIPKPAVYHIHKYQVWQKVNDGFLAGKVVDFLDNKHLKLRDFENNIWKVNCLNAKMYNMEMIYLGKFIKILGEKVSDDLFQAREVHPWKRNIFDQFVKPNIKIYKVK